MERTRPSVDKERSSFNRRIGGRPVEKDRTEAPLDWRNKSVADRIRMRQAEREREHHISGFQDVTPADRELLEKGREILDLPLFFKGEEVFVPDPIEQSLEKWVVVDYDKTSTLVTVESKGGDKRKNYLADQLATVNM